MRLSDYLRTNGIRQAEFAERIGLSTASVSRIANGLQKPDLTTLLAIERETGRRVLARDFAPEVSVETTTTEAD